MDDETWELVKRHKEAERYRRLRKALADRGKNGRSHYICSISEGVPEELDAAIDAIATEKQEKP